MSVNIFLEPERAVTGGTLLLTRIWIWRAHRSNPIGYADDMWVMDYRNGDQGRSSYANNWDAEKKQPKFMYNPDKVGFTALRWDDVINHKLGQDDIYYLSTEMAKPFDSLYKWKEGDTIPRRLLRIPKGSRGDIKGKGIWRDGKWQVEMTRLLDTGNPDDKALRAQRRYPIAFAVHKNYTGGRWHYISLPLGLGMGVETDIVARKFSGAEPPWEEIPWTTIPLFYPGQVTWEWLVSPAHAGAAELLKGQSCATCHTPELLGRYAVEHELRDDLRRSWYLTLGSGVIFVAGLALASVIAVRRRR
ncbi:MAG: ethylbenzene dehydrogenase-related protein [Candidatus Binatia bacterium]